MLHLVGRSLINREMEQHERDMERGVQVGLGKN